ncbi:MAG: NADP-reducing hydrogenase subunit HndD [Calditrichaeota bacterium]|nr:NADP-reducing hydrogenase subunit HndD [Calditrichota bacterium]
MRKVRPTLDDTARMMSETNETVTITIDGRDVEAPAGAYILDVAGELDIDIPSLCAHPGLEPFGACRLCVVEIQKPGWDDWYRQLVTSCLYPVADGLKVWTNSEEVRRNREVVLDLQLARVPKSDVIGDLAREYGVERTSYAERDTDDTCIMCAICVRACDAVGRSAIATLSRGPDKYVDVPDKDACIGCLVCAHLCPTDAIAFVADDNGKRTIWDKQFDLVTDERTGEVLGTPEYLEHVRQRATDRGLRWPDEMKHESAKVKRRTYSSKLARVGRIEEPAE